MSEKRVNIRITASTSDFDKAIKKAQKQIEKLADTIDDMGKGKFGDNLEKQLEKVTDAAKDMQKQLEEMQESLDDMNKSKMDKLEKKLEDTTDSAEDLNDSLENTTDTLEDMNKAKVDKLEKQFKEAKEITEKFDDKIQDVIDSLKNMDDIDIDNVRKSFEDIKDANQDLERRIDELLESFDELDSQNLDRLENEFEQVETSIRRTGDEIRNSFDDLDRKLGDTTYQIDNLDNALDGIDTDSFDKLEESVRDLDKYIDESTESMKELTDIDTSEYEKLSEVMGDISGSKNKFSLDSDSSGNKDKSNKGSSFATDMATELLGANVAANRISDSISDLSGHLNNVVDSMKEMNNLTPQEQAKAYDDLVNSMIKLQDEMNDVENSMVEIDTQQIDWREEEIRLTSEYIERLQTDIDNLTNSYEKLSEVQDKYKKSTKDYESALSDAEKEVEAYTNTLKELEDEAKKLNLKLFDEETGEQVKDIETIMDVYDKLVDSLHEKMSDTVHNNLGKIIESFVDLKDEAREAAESLDLLFAGEGDFYSYDEWIQEVIKQMKEFAQLCRDGVPTDGLERVRDLYREIRDALGDYNRAFEEQGRVEGMILDQKDALEGLANAQERLSNLKTDDRAKQYENECKAIEKLEGTLKTLANRRKELEDDQSQAKEGVQNLTQEYNELKNEAAALEDDMRKLQETLDKGNKIANEQADEINEQLKAYEKLSKRVREYLSDEEKHILLREKVAKSFKNTANAMEQIYAGSSKHNNADLITKTLKEAAEYVEKINLSSTKNLQNDLNRLGEIIEDKTDKIKRFKELSQEFGSKDSGLAHWLEQESKALKDYANKVPVVVEAMDTLRKAWGDVSVGGEDNLKLRARAELLDDFADKLKKNIAKIKSAYSELESLDDIYDKATDEEKIIIDDYKAWEKNKEALKEYNKAVTEYISTIKQMGGQIDDKFLDGFGKFDFDKFIEDFDRMGSSSVVLQKQFNACKIELQEWLQTEKEFRKEAVKNAELALEQAKANEKNAKSQDELREATEKTAKAQEELVEARKKLNEFTTDADKEIRKLNEIAEGFRKIGMAAEDLNKGDIAKFDKSLASLLDRMDTFGNDLPKTFGDLKEDIKGLFADMDGFDFGGVLDGLKDIGAGLLSKIPTELKVALGVATAIGVALKESAEMGIEHFGKGADTIKNALSGIVDIARDIGQELVSAFENITGMDLDLSSMIEIPVSFEAQMARVKSIGELTEEEFQRMNDLAIQLGANTRYGATEVAEAMEYMGQAGWGADEIEKGIEGVLNLATVADMGLDKATETVTDVINAFKEAGSNSLTADDAGKVADLLNIAAVKSSTSIEQLKSAFTNVAPIAGSFKMNLEDVTAALALMGDQGVKGAKAGTALKNLIANMNNPTEKRLVAMKKYNLLGARQAIVNGDLLGGIKQMKSALDGLSDSERNQIIEIVAGKEALSGVSALLNTSTESINELETAMNDCSGSAKEMAEGFDKTLKGALLDLSGSIESNLIKVYQKLKDGTVDVVNELTKFFNILGGFDNFNGAEGFVGAFAYLEEVSQGWGDAIATGLSNAIASLDDFINGGALDSLLQVGTNIIDGICNGIQEAADNGTLDSAISGAIKRIATWFSENLDTIVDVGKEVIDAISKGISENGDAIGECIKEVMEMQTEIDKAIAHEKWKLIGENLVTFILEGLWSKISVFWSGLTGFLESGITEAFGFIAEWMVKGVGTLFFDPVQALGLQIGEWLRDAIINAMEGAFDIDLSWTEWLTDPLGKAFGNKDSKKSTSSKKSSTGKTPDTSSITGQSPIDLINSELSSGKVKTDTTAAQIGQGISDNITKKLETMDAGALKELNTELQNLNTTTQSVASGMATSFTAIQDASRTSFMGLTNIVRNQMVNCTNIVRNQMINCTNIIRNQSVNWSNIIRNQATNARNAFTQQMMSMAAVARTQMVNVSNIIRNQAVNWYNIINNQAKKARDAFTSQMISMAKVASTQMSKVSSSIRGAMSQATSKAVSLNVSTNYSGLSANALYAANNASTMSLGNNMGALANNASYAMSTGGGSAAGSSIGSNVTLEIPVMLDGKELARASAKYVDSELKLMTKRENRKRGAK